LLLAVGVRWCDATEANGGGGGEGSRRGPINRFARRETRSFATRGSSTGCSGRALIAKVPLFPRSRKFPAAPSFSDNNLFGCDRQFGDFPGHADTTGNCAAFCCQIGRAHV